MRSGGGQFKHLKCVRIRVQQGNSIPASSLESPGIDHTRPADAFIAYEMRMAMQQPVDTFCKCDIHQFRQVAVRIGDGLVACLESSNGVVDVEAVKRARVPQFFFLPVAVPEDHPYFASAHRGDDIVAAQIAKVNELFCIVCFKQFKCSCDAVGAAM